MGATVDGTGFFLLTTHANPGPVSILDPNGRLIHKMEGFNYPRDVKILSDGFVWISELGGNNVFKY